LEATKPPHPHSGQNRCVKCSYSFVKYLLLHQTAREFQIWNWREQTVAFIFTIIVFVVLGPFETYSLPILQRLAFWFLCLLAGWTFVIAALTLVLRHPKLDDWSGLSRMVLAICIAIAPTAFAVWNIEELLRPLRQHHSLLRFFINIAFVCSLIGGALFLRVRSRLGTSANRELDNAPSFLDRLPVKLGTKVISLTMQDHYVEVTTASGSDLVLVRFCDAIDELRSVRGVQIHRSHWIAADAFKRLKRDNGKLVVELTDGRLLPVSRTYAPSVRTFFQT